MRFAIDPAELFSYMADFSNAAEWDPATSASDPITDGPVRVGSKFRIVTKFAGRELELTYEVIEHEPPARVVLRTFNGRTKIEDTMTVRPATGGSELSYDARITFPGALKLLDPVANLVFRRIGAEATRGLRNTLGGAP